MSDHFVIRGGRKLDGTLRVPGAKNAVLPLLAACLLSEDEVVLQDCPRLTDVENMIRILRGMGVKIRMEGSTLLADPSGAQDSALPAGVSGELRSSIFLLGSILSRFGRADCPYPGGCDIGLRPIDLHLKGLRAMGVRIEEAGGRILCHPSRLVGADIVLDYPSVGATENIMMAAARAEGTTVIMNAAQEPEIADLGDMINAMGGRVNGAGESVVTIQGVRKLHGVTHRMIPDRIVAGTYLMAAAITGGDVLLTQACPLHLSPVLHKLESMGCRVQVRGSQVRLQGAQPLMGASRIDTLPYPGFPTDLQAQIFALATVARGSTMIVENVFENRFRHAPELVRMGARVEIAGRVATIRGVDRLHGATVSATDLRAGAALVLAGLNAEGSTRVENIAHIDRGYEAMERDLTALGADIQREN